MTGWRLFKAMCVALLIAALFSQTTAYEQTDLWLAETVQQPWVAKEFHFTDTLIVDIDEESMVRLAPQFGAWPYKRDIYGLVTGYLKDVGARTVAYDILFSEQREGDDIFSRAIRHADNVVLSSVALSSPHKREASYHAQLAELAWPVSAPVPAKHWDDMTLPRMEFTSGLSATVRLGVINISPDEDGTLRRVSLLHESYGKYLPNAALAALFSQQPYPVIKYLPDEQHFQVGQYTWPVTTQGEILLQYPKNPAPFLVMPFYRLVFAAMGMPGYTLAPSEIQGKTIVIGSATASLGDYAVTPQGIRVGLHVVALTYQNLAQNMMLRPHKWSWDLILVLLCMAFPLLTMHRRLQSVISMSMLAIIGILSAYFLSLALLSVLNQQSALLFAVTAGLMLYFLMGLVRIKTLYGEKQRISYEKRVAEEANALKSKFLTRITHELRTPLTAIMGLNGFMSENPLLSSDAKKATQIIEQNSEYLLRLIDDLLDQAKIEAGQMDLDVHPVVIHDLIESVIDTLRGLAISKNVEVNVWYAEYIPSAIMVDGLRLRQIVINLLGNALKFSGPGRLYLRVRWENAWLDVAVQDTGPGILKNAQERIFEEFQQGHSSITHMHGGIGLGLTISRDFAHLMGGTLSVESVLNEGSTFSLRIPAPQTEMPGMDADGMQSRASMISFDRKLTGRVLLADDSEDARILFKGYFDKMGLYSVVVENGLIAVETALVEQPDIVLMDMEMPVMNGLDAVRLLRQRGYIKPILALTAHTSQSVYDELRQAGFDDCLSKPIKQDVLWRVLAERLSSPENPDSGHNVDNITVRLDPGLKKLIGGYLENRRRDVVVIRMALTKNDFDPVRAIGHNIKGTGGGYGLDFISKIGSELEQAALRSDATTITRLIAELADYLERLKVEFD